MARLQVNEAQVQCKVCGGKDFFQHQATLLTCNKCGNTFETDAEATLIPEQVVPAVD